MNRLKKELEELNNPSITNVGEYVFQYAQTDSVFAEKLKNENKTIKGMWEFIEYSVKKMFKEKTQCCMVEDKKIYGLAVHYFDEEETELDIEKRVKEEERKRKEEQEQQRKAEHKAKIELEAKQKSEAEIVKEKIRNKEQITLEDIDVLNKATQKKKMEKQVVVDGQISLF